VVSCAKSSIFFITVLLAGSALGLGEASAQSVAEPRTWTVTPFLGGSMGLGDPANNDSLGIGAAVGYDWTSNLGFEGEFGHLFDVAGDTNALDWSITNFSANVLYHFDVKHVTPYATFGIGFERSNLDITDPDILALFPESSTEIAYNFGGGVKYPVSPRLLLRGDIRRFNANDLAPDYWRVYGGVTFRIGR
jgi:opacity protein-like surface antigen